MIVNERREFEQIVREVLTQIKYEGLNDWLTPEFIANDLSVSPATVRNWCRSGALEGKKFDSLWRIKRSMYLKFLAER